MNREDALTLIEHYAKEPVSIVFVFNTGGTIAFNATDFKQCKRLPGEDLFEVEMTDTSKSAFSAVMINSIGVSASEQPLSTEV